MNLMTRLAAATALTFWSTAATAFTLWNGDEPRWTQPMVWRYSAEHQPARYETARVVEAISGAMARWSRMCGVAFIYAGTTAALPSVDPVHGWQDGISVIGWRVFEPGEATFAAVANISLKDRAYGEPHGRIIEADVALNSLLGLPYRELEGLLNHEIGHAIGLLHSTDPKATMAPSPWRGWDDWLALRGDDFRGCAYLYGAVPGSDVERVMNWAEDIAASYFHPVGQPTRRGIKQHRYRHYPETGAYIGETRGTGWITGGTPLDGPAGAIEALLPKAETAGY